MNSLAEENYLKAIYQLARKANTSGAGSDVSTSSLAQRLDTKPASVTDMLKKLSAKRLINYKKYQGVSLTPTGQDTAVEILRKHRLWEVFLVEKLQFKWDEVHEIAEQLEHIQSDELIRRLDNFLGNPTHDPHGDPIPDAEGNVYHHQDFTLSDLKEGGQAVIIGVKDSSKAFLQYLEEKQLVLGTKIKVLELTEFDGSMSLQLNGHTLAVSSQVANNLYVRTSIKSE